MSYRPLSACALASIISLTSKSPESLPFTRSSYSTYDRLSHPQKLAEPSSILPLLASLNLEAGYAEHISNIFLHPAQNLKAEFETMFARTAPALEDDAVLKLWEVYVRTHNRILHSWVVRLLASLIGQLQESQQPCAAAPTLLSIRPSAVRAQSEDAATRETIQEPACDASVHNLPLRELDIAMRKLSLGPIADSRHHHMQLDARCLSKQALAHRCSQAEPHVTLAANPNPLRTIPNSGLQADAFMQYVTKPVRLDDAPPKGKSNQRRKIAALPKRQNHFANTSSFSHNNITAEAPAVFMSASSKTGEQRSPRSPTSPTRKIVPLPPRHRVPSPDSPVVSLAWPQQSPRPLFFGALPGRVVSRTPSMTSLSSDDGCSCSSSSSGPSGPSTPTSVTSELPAVAEPVLLDFSTDYTTTRSKVRSSITKFSPGALPFRSEPICVSGDS